MAKVVQRTWTNKHGEGVTAWEVRWVEQVTRVNADGTTTVGRTTRRKTVPTKRDGEALAREIEAAKLTGGSWTPPASRPVATLGAVAEAWIANTMNRRPAATARFRASVLQRFLDYADAELPVVELTGGLLRAYADHLAAVGVKSVSRYVGTVEQLWAWAYDNGDTYPGVPQPRRVTGADRDVPHRPPPVAVDTPTWADVDRLIWALTPSGGEAWKERTRTERGGGEARGVGYRPAWEVYRRLVTVQRFTGLRVSQILALRGSDVDLDLQRLTVRAGTQGAKGQRRDRVVPMHPALAQEIASWGALDTDELIFSRTATKGPRQGERIGLTGKEVAEVLAAAWARSGVRRTAWGAESREHARPTNAIRACWKSAISGAASYELAALMLGQSARGEHDSYVAVGNPEASPYWDAMRRALEVVPPIAEAHDRGLMLAPTVPTRSASAGPK
jgi:integrase